MVLVREKLPEVNRSIAAQEHMGFLRFNMLANPFSPCLHCSLECSFDIHLHVHSISLLEITTPAKNFCQNISFSLTGIVLCYSSASMLPPEYFEVGEICRGAQRIVARKWNLQLPLEIGWGLAIARPPCAGEEDDDLGRPAGGTDDRGAFHATTGLSCATFRSCDMLELVVMYKPIRPSSSNL